MRSYIKQIYPFEYLVTGYLVTALILSAITGMRINFSTLLYSAYDLTFLSTGLLYLIIFFAISALQSRKNGDDRIIFGSNWRKNILKKHISLRKLTDLIRALISLKLTLLIYCNIKQAIPSLNGTLYDTELLHIDKLIHFGFNPSVLAVKMLGNDISARFFDTLYIFWYMLKPLILAYFAIIAPKTLYIRFFTAYFAMWITGGLLAVIIPSLGPIYTNPEWFKDLHIRFAPALQSKLITHYNAAVAHPEKYKVYIYEGVAAFPSLHVGIIALFALFFIKINRTVAVALILYTVIIQIGSVLLGWHYAVDGYAGIILAGTLYYASQFMHFNRPPEAGKPLAIVNRES